MCPARWGWLPSQPHSSAPRASHRRCVVHEERAADQTSPAQSHPDHEEQIPRRNVDDPARRSVLQRERNADRCFRPVSGTAPWVLRIDDIKAATAVYVEAERKAAQLIDEMQVLTRTIRIKDQTIQEMGEKVELMERRMGTLKKQADAITDLENELAKARKRERAYEQAMEQLQADGDALEQDNTKLKTPANNPERQASTTQVVEAEAVTTKGSLETWYLLEQVRERVDVDDHIVVVLPELLSSKLMRSAVLSDSCARRTGSSRARPSSRRSRRCPSCLYPFPVHQRPHSFPRHSPTRTPMMSPGRHQSCVRSQRSRSSSTARLSSIPRPRASSTSPCSRRHVRTDSRRRRRGCRGRRHQPTNSLSARCRASGWRGD